MKDKLYIPTNMDMLEIAMEIESQYSDGDEIEVIYEDSWPEMGIKEGDSLGVITFDFLRGEGLIS